MLGPYQGLQFPVKLSHNVILLHTFTPLVSLLFRSQIVVCVSILMYGHRTRDLHPTSISECLTTKPYRITILGLNTWVTLPCHVLLSILYLSSLSIVFFSILYILLLILVSPYPETTYNDHAGLVSFHSSKSLSLDPSKI